MAWPDGDRPAVAPAPGPRFRDLTVRILAGAVLAVLAVAAILLGPYGVVAITLVVLGGVALEWHRLIGRGLPLAWAVCGGAYLAVAGFCFLYLYFGVDFASEDEVRRDTLFWFLALVIATDTGAYGFGRWLGGPKLAPRISPKKTWSGFLGGIGAAATAGLAVAALVGAESPLLLALTAIMLSFVSQIGDLAKSLVKRRVGVKDAGAIIPGHGGMLDRFDGLAAAAVALALAQVLAGEGPLAWG